MPQWLIFADKYSNIEWQQEHPVAYVDYQQKLAEKQHSCAVEKCDLDSVWEHRVSGDSYVHPIKVDYDKWDIKHNPVKYIQGQMDVII